MRKNFYLKLALGNIRKNGKFYLPFLLTCIAAAAMFFNMCSIYTNETLTSRQDAQMILGLGVIVIALFSAIFLFYTNISAPCRHFILSFYNTFCALSSQVVLLQLVLCFSVILKPKFYGKRQIYGI